LELSAYYSDYRRDRCKNWADIIPALTKHTDTLTKLHLCINGDILPLSLVPLFLNLQEIKITMHSQPAEDFKVLHVTFPQLQTLKIYVKFSSIKSEHMTKFLEINGKNLRVFYLEEIYYRVINPEEINNARNNAINLSIVNFCPNLKKLYVTFKNGDMLKTIFDSCQYLEGITIRCGEGFLNNKEVFETVAKHSPKNFYELELRQPNLVPEDLEFFFISWNNRELKRSLSLIFYDDYSPLSVKEENMKIIEKYKNLGVVKKFELEILSYTSPKHVELGYVVAMKLLYTL